MTTLPKARPVASPAPKPATKPATKTPWQRQSKPQPHLDGLWHACQNLVKTWEAIGDLIPLPTSLTTALIGLERALLQYTEVEEAKRFYDTKEATQLLGVTDWVLYSRVDSGRFVQGVHYQDWTEPGHGKRLFTWNVWAINQLMAVSVAARKPLPTQLAGGGSDGN